MAPQPTPNSTQNNLVQHMYKIFPNTTRLTLPAPYQTSPNTFIPSAENDVYSRFFQALTQSTTIPQAALFADFSPTFTATEAISDPNRFVSAALFYNKEADYERGGLAVGFKIVDGWRFQATYGPYSEPNPNRLPGEW